MQAAPYVAVDVGGHMCRGTNSQPIAFASATFA